MKYIAQIIFYDGSEEIEHFNTPGKAMDHVTDYLQSGYPIYYGVVYKRTHGGVNRPIWGITI